jgi:hypothetical protein
MIDKLFCKELVKRFSGLFGFPTSKEALADVVCGLQAFPRPEQAQAFVDDWMRRETSCPKPADINRLAYQLVEIEEYEARRRPPCLVCEGVGFISEIRRMRAGASVDSQSYVFAKPCPNGCKPSHVKGEWSKPLHLCADCREWGAFGWVKRGDHFEHCPNFELHGDDVSTELLDVINGISKKPIARQVRAIFGQVKTA